jgi:phosphate transport system permease protein
MKSRGRFADAEHLDLRELQHSLRHPRTLLNALFSGAATVLTLVALFPLFSVLYLLAVRGGSHLSLATLTALPPAAMVAGGGFGNAIVGTIVIVGIATAISVPFGIMAAVFLVEFGPETRTAVVVRFAAKILTGLPSILAGVFAFAIVVMLTGGFSAPAGGVALALLMLPTILLTAEEAIKMVPAKMREAAIGMGATPAQVVWRVSLPTASPGILTGVMLAVARAAGETAPLLFTAVFSTFWMSRSSPEFVPKTIADLMKPTPSLAVLIYNFSSSPFDNQIQLAWTAALVLVVLVLVMNLAGRALSSRAARL